jgi:alpha-amylase
MKTVQFIFGIHNHQPVGNFDFVFEEAYQRSYLPFLEVAENHPEIALSLHYSGCLLEWLEDHHPEFIDRVARLVRRGNIELLSAGFYEPILAVIPDHDKLGQIRKMNAYLRDRFGYDPSGLWLTERVWEPHLAKPIHEAGIRYLTVDDFHFLAGGKALAELTGYFNTDEQGHGVGVFPISQRLRYAMPFQSPEVTIRLLRKHATESGDNVLVMADDGEKFGVWPGTYERCFGKRRWLERFFRLLEKNRDWLRTTTFKDYYTSHPPRGRVYLPTVSYFEMSEWTLPAEQGSAFADLVHEYEHRKVIEKYRPFLRGGTWRNFLSLYEESNWMLKRTSQVSARLATAQAEHRLNGKAARPIQDEIWRSQCNCAYWHGVFGGLYLPHLRHAIYTHLLAAETALDARLGSDNQTLDLDNDGALEYVLQSDTVKLIVTQKGGCIREFDILPRRFNLLDTMRRYRESYHRKVLAAGTRLPVEGSIHNVTVAKETGLARYLQVDRWPRLMLLDHFLPQSATAGSVRDRQPEKGNFPAVFYTVTATEQEFMLTGEGAAFGCPVRIVKHLRLDGSELDIRLAVTNKGTGPLRGRYGSELNFALLGGHAPDRYYEIDGRKPRRFHLDVTANDRQVESVGVVNEWDRFRVTVRFSELMDVWRFPVVTVSMSESGFEKIYQSSVVIPHRLLELEPGETKEFRWRLMVELWDAE